MEGNEKPKIFKFFLLMYFYSLGGEKTVTTFHIKQCILHVNIVRY